MRAITAEEGPRIALEGAPRFFKENSIFIKKFVMRSPCGHPIHLRVTHGRGLHGLHMSFVLLNLGSKRHAGASRAHHGKHKQDFLMKHTPERASPSRRIIYR